MNITLRSLSNKSSFEILDGKLYLYIDVDEINSFETARLLVQLDKHRMKVQNYNVDLKGRDVWD